MVNTKSTVWGSMFNAATAAEVIEHLGRDHVAAIMRRHNPAGLAVSRATGCWDANDGEGYSAYTRLAQLILANEVQAAAAAPRASPRARPWVARSPRPADSASPDPPGVEAKPG